MSTDNNTTSKISESPLDVPSRPAPAVMMRDDTTVPVLCAKNSAIQNAGSRRNGQNYFYYLAGGRSVSYCGP